LFFAKKPEAQRSLLRASGLPTIFLFFIAQDSGAGLKSAMRNTLDLSRAPRLCRRFSLLLLSAAPACCFCPLLQPAAFVRCSSLLLLSAAPACCFCPLFQPAALICRFNLPL